MIQLISANATSKNSDLTHKVAPLPSATLVPIGDTESSDGEGYTLAAWGDIPLSNAYFVPGAHSDLSPVASPVRTPPRKVKKTPVFRRNVRVHLLHASLVVSDLGLIQFPLPSVIQNILPPSPSAAAISPGTDFDRLVGRMRESREKTTGHSSGSLASAKQKKAIEKLNTRISAGKSEKTPPLGPCLAARKEAPKPKERPLRGYGKLPARPPLPRWDLMNESLEDGRRSTRNV